MRPGPECFGAAKKRMQHGSFKYNSMRTASIKRHNDAHALQLVSYSDCRPIIVPNMGHAQADHHHSSPESLGSVTFATSCSNTVQPQFNRAAALMHSFQFESAIEAFDAILGTDPPCSIAYWGIALSNWGNPFAAGLKSPAQLEQGLKAVKQARVAPPKTERERAYVEAVAHLFTDTANTDQQSRKLSYEGAMAALSAAHPEDTEATIFYALALAAAADPADKTLAKQLKAGAISRLRQVDHSRDLQPAVAGSQPFTDHKAEIEHHGRVTLFDRLLDPIGPLV